MIKRGCRYISAPFIYIRVRLYALYYIDMSKIISDKGRIECSVIGWNLLTK